MKLMLDTDICIYLIKKHPIQILEKFRSFKVSDLGISSITLSELQFGVYKSQNISKNLETLNRFLLPLEIAYFDEDAAAKYGQTRANLERIGKLIGPMDLLIASHALSLGIALVTNNQREFKRIQDLKTLNWA